jgi:hypothetical protein
MDCQTVEDGAPRDLPRVEHDRPGHPDAMVTATLKIRSHGGGYIDARRLVIRAHQYDGSITASLEALRVEDRTA